MKKYVIETERLVIRPYEKSDYENRLQQFQGRLDTQHKYDEGKIDTAFFTKEFYEQRVEKFQQMMEKDEVYIWGIFRKSDGVHLGGVDILTILRGQYQWCGLGYEIHNQFWRNGYGKEAVKAVIDFTFTELGFHRIEVQINVDNVPSRKLAEDVGMVFEGIRKGFIFENDEWVDHVIYARNRCEEKLQM